MSSIAIIGSGISGLSAAWHLTRQWPEARITLLEAGAHYGGHANTVDVTLDGVTHGVDTGFLVYNERTYPGLIDMLTTLQVESAPSEMSFSVRSPRGEGQAALEWSGHDLNTVFVQRRNLLSPRFWSMLRDILRFNRLTTELANTGAEAQLQEPIGDYLARHRFGEAFKEDYFLPMVACIWSCPTQQMLRFPMATMIRFCHNHGLLQIANRPQWYTIKGGSQRYVSRIIQTLADARLNTAVHSVKRSSQGVVIETTHGSERHDHVVLACHSDQALRLLGAEASNEERAVLGAIRYQANRAVLHTDTGMLPAHPKAWAAWNYERAERQTDEDARVCLHYLINKLQPLPWQRPVIVSLNPVREPQQVLAEIDYAHPVFDQAAIEAQRLLPALQGRLGVWFAGAWCGYGFHEDGYQAGQRAAQGILNQRAEGLRHAA